MEAMKTRPINMQVVPKKQATLKNQQQQEQKVQRL